MKKLFFITLVITCFFLIIDGCNQAKRDLSRNRNFDSGWLFIKDSAIDASDPGFDDSSWRKLDLPHDWSIEDLPGQDGSTIVGPFSISSQGGMNTGYFVGGTGWYRKKFKMNQGDKNKLAILNFDGVYMDCDAWLNGKHLGNHPYGYTPFNFDITGFLNPPGKENVLSVRVRNAGLNSRWYSGSGIYRHVTLMVTDRVHIIPWGVYVMSHVSSSKEATVMVNTTVENRTKEETSVKVKVIIQSGLGKTVSESDQEGTIGADKIFLFNHAIAIKDPMMWSTEKPELYTALVEVYTGKVLTDQVPVTFGVRSLEFSAEKGFLLNGEKVLLKGGCLHHDNGILGSATFDRAEERRVELMKSYGYNAIRTSHNPPSRQFLDACDRLGMLVIDEAFDMWKIPKNPQDYSLFFAEWWQKDIESMVLRDRNHPSVIMWSIGNEINERSDSSGLEIAKNLVDEVRNIDPSRPITEAMCQFWDHPGRSWDATAPSFELLDVGGYNYQWKKYESDHKLFPSRIMAGTESTAMEAFDNWQMVEKNPYVIGDFIWTAMDYMGETAIGHTITDDQKNDFRLPWPWFNSNCGDIDLVGFKKPQSLYRDVLWKNSKIELMVHHPIPKGRKEVISYWGWPDESSSWNWKGREGEPFEVRVFTRCRKVRLELNGKIIGEKEVSDQTRLIVVFTVPFEEGTLKAVGLENNVEVCSKTISTTGAAKKIRLIPDRSIIKTDRNDLSFVKIEVTDESGNIVPDANIPVQLEISGNGELAAAGNACPNEMASFRKPGCKTFRGLAMAIIRPTGNTGNIKLIASSKNIEGADVEISVQK
jgi:beta-galactosidase